MQGNDDEKGWTEDSGRIDGETVDGSVGMEL